MSHNVKSVLPIALCCCLALAAPAGADAPPGRYTVHNQGTGTLADDTVTDNRTGLTWQREVSNTAAGCDPSAYCTRSQAIAYCQGLALDNGGWRLPKISELLTLVDPTVYNPAIDGLVFPSTPLEFFWSSSPYAGNAGFTWAVYFVEGTSDYYPNSNTARVRCVR